MPQRSQERDETPRLLRLVGYSHLPSLLQAFTGKGGTESMTGFTKPSHFTSCLVCFVTSRSEHEYECQTEYKTGDFK